MDPLGFAAQEASCSGQQADASLARFKRPGSALRYPSFDHHPVRLAVYNAGARNQVLRTRLPAASLAIPEEQGGSVRRTTSACSVGDFHVIAAAYCTPGWEMSA
jgi:hypothetical protein